MSTIRQISDGLADAVSALEPSILTLHRSRSGGATGVAWGKDLVVTAAHQLEREEGIELSASGRRVSASLVGIDPASDLAVLRVEAELAPLPLISAGALRVGELVLALGRPGEGVRARLGIVGFVGGEWRLPGGSRFERYIESDVSPLPGFSGGPLVRGSGEVIGLNTAALLRGKLVTLASEGVRRIVETLVAHGRVRRARLGVAVQRVALPRELAAGRAQSHGLIVLSVESNSPADVSGLRLGDVLLRLAGARLTRVEELQAALDPERIGQEHVLELVRAGEPIQLSIQPEARS